MAETIYAPAKSAQVAETEQMFQSVFQQMYGVDPSAKGPKPALQEWVAQLGKVAQAALGGRGGIGTGGVEKSKMVRLYRGEGRLAPEGSFWRDPEMQKLAGRWFTTDLETAKIFAAEAKFRRLGPGRVVSVEVPAEVFEASRLDKLPHLQKYRYGLTELGDVVLPPKWVDRAIPLESR